MKREIIIASLLAAMIALSLINIICIRKLSGSIISEIELMESLAANEDYEASLSCLTKALNHWDKNALYTGVFLKQPDIDIINDCFYDLMSEILRSENKSIPALSAKLKYHVQSICDMENLRLESIF